MEWNKEEGIIFPFVINQNKKLPKSGLCIIFQKKSAQVRDAMYFPTEKKCLSPRCNVLSFRKKTLKSEMEWNKEEGIIFPFVINQNKKLPKSGICIIYQKKVLKSKE